MPRVRNAFKIRAADSPIIETSQFLQLYCPLLLDQLEHDDLFVPKLIVVRGSPGSGKSSLLRLFETNTLLALHARKSQPSDQDLVERLTELGVFSGRGPQVVGIYIQCDSSLRDIANLTPPHNTHHLFNTLLDIRILASFLRGLRRLAGARVIDLSATYTLDPLPPGDAPPILFREARTIDQMESLCAQIERDFGTLLNSFPGDPLPSSIQPHARTYVLAYLALQAQRSPILSELKPLIMLDDVQELYQEQREHLRKEFIRRVGVPRWLSARTQVFGLEEIISLEGVEEGREYREIPLDEIFQEKPSVFTKFSANVIHRRLQVTESLQQVTVEDFKDLLRTPDGNISSDHASKAITSIAKRASDLRFDSFLETLQQLQEKSKFSEVTFDQLQDLEKSLILIERKANRGQGSLFPEMEVPESDDGKTKEAALLFASKRLGRPYYFGLDALTNLASGNVEQLLSTTAVLVDRMIYRAELDREKAISARDQETILKKCADEYYGALEEKHRRGGAIRQFVDNFGAFCQLVTYRPNAPIAPGVNGFGLTRSELVAAVKGEKKEVDASLFREILTSAVAGNVLSVRVTKQGQTGSEKIIFYFNRLLCVKYRLPLNYGGWQHLHVEILYKMMQQPVPVKEMARKGSNSGSLLWGDGEL